MTTATAKSHVLAMLTDDYTGPSGPQPNRYYGGLDTNDDGSLPIFVDKIADAVQYKTAQEAFDARAEVVRSFAKPADVGEPGYDLIVMAIL